MSKLTFDRIVPLISDRNSTTFQHIVREIADLKQKFANPETQSFYFKRGIESQKVRLKKILIEYDEIKDFINGNEISDFHDMIEENKTTLKSIKINSSLNMMAYQSIEHSIKHFEECIAVKKKYGTIDDSDLMAERL